MRNKFIRMLAVLACLVCCIVMMQVVASAGDGMVLKVEVVDTDNTGEAFRITPIISGDTVETITVTDSANHTVDTTLDNGSVTIKVAYGTYSADDANNTGRNAVIGDIYKVTVKTANETESYVKLVNLKIKNCYLATNKDMLIKEIIATENARDAVNYPANFVSELMLMVKTYTRVSEQPMTTGLVRASSASKAAINGAIQTAGNNYTSQQAVDAAQQALYFARRNFVYSVDFEFIHIDSTDGKFYIVAPRKPSEYENNDAIAGAMLSGVSYAEGVYPSVTAYGKLSSQSKVNVPTKTGTPFALESGVYTFVGTISLGGITTKIMRVAVYRAPESTKGPKEIFTEALKKQFGYDGGNANDANGNRCITDAEIESIVGSKSENFSDSEMVRRAQAYYTTRQREMHEGDENTLSWEIRTGGIVDITAKNAYTVNISLRDSNGALVVDRELGVMDSKNGAISPFYAPKSQTSYTVTVTYLDGNVKSDTIRVEDCAAPITLNYSSGRGISVSALSGVTIEHMYYTYGAKTSIDTNVDYGITNFISADGKSSVPALGKGTHTFYIKAKFHGTVVDGFYEIDVNDDNIGPVVTVINGTVGVFHYSLGSKNDVKSIAYAKGDYSNWTTMSGAEDLTFVPTGNVTLSMAGFEQSEYTFCFITNDGTPTFVHVEINPDQANT